MTAVLCKIDLHLPAIHSLKEKRSVLKKLMARIQGQFSVVVAEVGYHDLLQRAELGFCYVGSDSKFLNSLVDKTLAFVDQLSLGEVVSTNRESVQL